MTKLNDDRVPKEKPAHEQNQEALMEAVTELTKCVNKLQAEIVTTMTDIKRFARSGKF